MQAEAMERYNGGAGAKALYDAGVRAAFSKARNFNDDSINEANQTWIYEAPYNYAPFVATGGAYEYPASGTFEEKLSAIYYSKVGW